ncbi:MAG: RNA methyltransferase [Cyanobacteria bacterium J003]|uniref:RNA methyltransferase n=1 Tax=Thermosynechococcus sp. M3746_W2019_013 TaxID=2747806 RepID=UPI000F12CD5A|nr:RNA methyltransferase [Thermosynechococcus sp. M3746_W2019_013]RMH65189.1 MAG: RNA methyltransferase [Cyanobacteria bacterium J003]HIK23967.1 RNA methyltransferase [Thermosynechococcus sp. M3746_W2019_013]
MDTLPAVRIVLVEPQGEINIGSIARVMKNMGLQQLWMVSPRCDPKGELAQRWAVHAEDVLQQAKVTDSLEAALADCQRVFATVGRDVADLALPCWTPRQAAPQLLAVAQSALVFGREDRGLTNAELECAQGLVKIPTANTYPSLNLAQAVAVCCYELWLTACDSVGTFPQGDAVPFERLQGFYDHLEQVLLQIGFLYPHTAASRMTKVRSLLGRAYPTEAEVALLRGMVRQVEWAIQHAATIPSETFPLK